MFDPVFCVLGQHDLKLVALAALVCLLASATTLRMLSIGRASQRRVRWLWLLFAGAVGGSGVWATHFIAMLAFDPGVATGYDLAGTALSLVVALAAAALATLWAYRLKGPRRLFAWGAVLGGGIGAMHYLGMFALIVPGRLVWAPAYVVASFAAAALLSALALRIHEQGPSVGRFALASATLAAAICALHFTGMAGVKVVLDPSLAAPAIRLPHDALAVLVGGLTGLILLAAATTIWVDGRTQNASLKLLRSVMDVMPSGLAYYDREDRFVLGNEAYRRDLEASNLKPRPGVTYRDMLGRGGNGGPGSAMIEGGPETRDEILEARGGASSTRYRRLDDGRYVRVETYRTGDGGLVTVVTDVTSLKQQADDLSAARDAAEAAVRAKSAFLANMSHELRTPMNGVLAVSELLAQSGLTPHQAELVEIIRASGAVLGRLLGDLLDISRVEAGAVEIVKAAFDPEAAIRALVALHLPAARDKGLALIVDIGPGVDVAAVGDQARLSQVLGNLVSNAVKFTDRGRVEVRVRRRDETLDVEVLDTGVGFDEAFKARIFSRFEQADDSITRRFGGTGLGLAIARDLTVRMGGSLTCDGTSAAGSVFRLSLPLPVVAEPVAAEPVVTMNPDQAHILVVDDNPTNQRVLALMLGGAGIRVALAANGQEGLEAWRAGAFDAVLMDMQMPVMDGLSATTAIRAEEAELGASRTPILMVSANALPEHVEAARLAGADGHVAKPVTADRLFGALAALGDPTPPACEDRAA